MDLERLHRFIMGKTLWSLGIRVAGVGLTFIAYILLARAMPKEAYGDFIYCVNLIAVTALVAQAGFQASVVRYVHEYHATPAYLAGYIRTSFIWPLVIAFACAGLAYGAQALGLLPAIVARVLPYLVIGAVFFAITYVAQQSLKATQRIVASQIFEQIGLPLALGVAAAFFLLHDDPMPFASAATVYIGVFVMVACITWVWFLRTSYPRNQGVVYRFWPWVRSSASMGITSLVSTLMTRLDVLLIGIFLASDAVAEYGVAARIAALLAFIYAALGNSLVGTISQKFHSGTLADIAPLVQKLMRLTLVLNLAAFTVIVLLRDFIVGLFGEAYLGAADILVVLGFVQAVNLSAGPMGSILMITGHQNLYLRFTCMFAALLAVALWYAIPAYGLMGAALATACINLFMNVALGVLVYRMTGLRSI